MPQPIKLTDSVNVPTPHNEANVGDFAETVLMPGDPLRAQKIAKEYLEEAKLVNNIRNIQGYTGKYKGKKVSVMGSGMGQPSMAIYSYELFKYYNVENIIRIGSIGSFKEGLHLGDLVIATSCSTDSGFYRQYGVDGAYAATADTLLISLAWQSIINHKYRFTMGNILSSDRFYSPKNDLEAWQKLGVVGVEMEAASLYCNAAYLRRRAIAIATVSNSFVYPNEDMTSEERQNSMDHMIRVALDTAYYAHDIDKLYPEEEGLYIR